MGQLTIWLDCELQTFPSFLNDCWTHEAQPASFTGNCTSRDVGGLRNVLSPSHTEESHDDALLQQHELVMKQLITKQGHQ